MDGGRLVPVTDGGRLVAALWRQLGSPANCLKSVPVRVAGRASVTALGLGLLKVRGLSKPRSRPEPVKGLQTKRPGLSCGETGP